MFIDPWFTDSTLENPLIEGLTGQKTIDYLIPPADPGTESIKANAVLLSHYHAHHAPLIDIQNIARNGGSDFTIAGPLRKTDGDSFAREKISAVRPDVKWREFAATEEWTIGDLKIRAMTHTRAYHLAWYIQHPGGNILHIADANTNRRPYDSRLDPLWLSFADLDISHLFVSTGRHFTAGEHQGRPYIVEGTMDPTAVAYLAHILQPRCLSLIGMYNFSVWKNRVEYILPVGQSEEQTVWSLQKLSPHIRFVHLLPGKEFRYSRAGEVSRIEEILFQGPTSRASSHKS